MAFFGRANKHNKSIAIAGVALASLGLIGYGVWGFWQQYRSTHRQDVRIPTQVLTHSTDEPDETPPTDACQNYQVAADKPRKIVIAAIGIDACIQPVGIDQHNAITAPSNVHLAGWYVRSVLPGTTGVSLIDGHSSGRYDKNAVFAKLGQLKPNDTISIQLGDGSRHEFTVRQTNSYPVAEVMEHALQPLDRTLSELNLITCGGPYVDGAYTDRILVQATGDPS